MRNLIPDGDSLEEQHRPNREHPQGTPTRCKTAAGKTTDAAEASGAADPSSYQSIQKLPNASPTYHMWSNHK
jgi:hypothetical protein